MHFNLFATGLLLSMASALDIEASSNDEDGTVPRQYVGLEDNCCIFYAGDQYTQMYKEPICWDKETGKPSKKTYLGRNGVRGLDCGKNTWADLDSEENV